MLDSNVELKFKFWAASDYDQGRLCGCCQSICVFLFHSSLSIAV